MVKRKIAKSSGGITERAEAIKRLRTSLGLGQRALAVEVQATQAMVWGWETGRSVPSASVYIKLGNKAAKANLPEAALKFWQWAGISPESVSLLAPSIRDLIEKRVAGKAAMVPILRSVAYVDAPTIAPPGEVEEWIALPAAVFESRAKSLSCLRVPHAQVRSFFGQGDLVLLDSSEQAADRLGGQVIAAYHTPEREVSDLGPRPGLHIGLLRQRDVGEHDSIAELDSSILNFIPREMLSQAEALGVDKYVFRDQAVVIAMRLKSRAYVVQPPWKVLGRVVGWLASLKATHQDGSKKKAKK